AKVDVETGPVALRVGQTEAAKRAVGPAVDYTARLDRIERLGRCRRRGKGNRRRKGECGYGAFHDTTFSRLEGDWQSLGQPSGGISERSPKEVKGLTIRLFDAVNAPA